MSARAAAALPKPAPRDPDGFVLPHNLEAERSVLGAALLHENQADYVTDKLTPADFFRRAHQTVFEAIRELRRRSCGVDIRLLAEQLGVRKLDEVGGPAYLAAMMDGVPRSTNVEHYVAVLKDLHAKRSIYHYANLTADYVADGSHNSATLLQDADRRLMELQAGHFDGRMVSLRESASRLLPAIEWRVAHRGELIGLDTGYPSINETTSGWQGGDMTVLGARPSIGKTTLLLNMAVAVARALLTLKRAGAVLLFSFEMKLPQLEFRILSSLSQIPLQRIINGVIMEHEWKTLSEAIALMGELPITIDDTSGQTRWQIRSKCRRVLAEQGLAMVGIDYVQLIPGSLERRGASRNEELTDISRGVKELADELSVPILLLSQLSRPKSMFGKDPEPQLSDLRDCGALEQDADNVAFLHRKDHRNGGPTAFLLKKQRNGPTGTMVLSLDRDTVTFTDAPDATIAPAPKDETPDDNTKKRKRGEGKTYRRMYGAKEND